MEVQASGETRLLDSPKLPEFFFWGIFDDWSCEYIMTLYVVNLLVGALPSGKTTFDIILTMGL